MAVRPPQRFTCPCQPFMPLQDSKHYLVVPLGFVTQAWLTL